MTQVRTTRRSLILALLVVAGGMAGPLQAQSIRGTVADARNGAPLSTVEVTASFIDGEPLAQALTDNAGNFTLSLPGAGTYQISASLLGYRDAEPTPVEVETWTGVTEIQILLSTEPIELEGITVRARGTELKHRASVEGFFERQRNGGLRVGGRRQYLASDPLVQSATDVGILMRNALIGTQGCVAAFLNGRPALDLQWETLYGIVGFESYYFHNEAPMELRARGGQLRQRDGVLRCQAGTPYSVIALWTEPPPPVRDPATIRLRIHDEATGLPLMSRVFELMEDSLPRLVEVFEEGVGDLRFEEDEEVTLIARAGGYFDSAPILLTPEDREDGIAIVWMRHINPMKQYEAVAAARDQAAEATRLQSAARGDDRAIAVKVRDEEGAPIPIVQVWADTIPLGITDASGFYRHTFEEPIRTKIRLTRLGMGEVSTEIDFEQTSEAVFIEATMRPELVVLDPITVTATSRKLLADVESIQHSILLGRGTFVTRRAVEVRGYPPMGRLAQGIPGVAVRGNVPYSRRAPMCGPMSIFVDGVYLIEPADILRTSSLDVELVEVYPGGGSVPAQYQIGTTRCGVVAYWTRRGGPVELSDILEFDGGRSGAGAGGSR